MFTRMFTIRVSPASLATNNAGLDLEASAARYVEALEPVLRSELGEPFVLVIDAALASTRIELDDPTLEGSPRAVGARRRLDDLLWVVRQMSDWAVVAR